MRPAILVVDDEKIVRLFLEKTLGKKYDLIVKENGSEVLEWLQQGKKPDLIISDLHMPYLDGYDLLKSIKANQDLSSIPVLMLSGMDSSEEKEKCLNLGADDYLTKPLNIVELIQRVENLIPS